MRSARREESCGFAAKTSICGQHKGGKDIMGSTSRTRSPYTRLVRGDGRLAHGMIGGCVWMKNPYVKECIL